MSYATDKEVAQAEALGYTWDSNQHRGHVFEQGDRHVWSCHKGWQTADLLDGSYRNHRIFNDLSGALKRPLVDD
jgi:hypothetical protein